MLGKWKINSDNLHISNSVICKADTYGHGFFSCFKQPTYLQKQDQCMYYFPNKSGALIRMWAWWWKRAPHLVGVGAGDADGVEQVFQAMRDRPQVESHFSCHQRVRVVKQVDVAPGQRTVLLHKHARKMKWVKIISKATAPGYLTDKYNTGKLFTFQSLWIRRKSIKWILIKKIYIFLTTSPLSVIYGQHFTYKDVINYYCFISLISATCLTNVWPFFLSTHRKVGVFVKEVIPNCDCSWLHLHFQRLCQLYLMQRTTRERSYNKHLNKELWITGCILSILS